MYNNTKKAEVNPLYCGLTSANKYLFQ